ncbi:MAG: hypothetical protein IJ323_02380, partial [Clostridia bacterium]|nr:hypothetical protein [Clostridia bacterium]
PTGITVEGTTFKGLDSSKTYSVAAYTLAGADADVKTVTGVEEYDISTVFDSPVGLYAIYFASDSADYADSNAVLVYIKGDYEARADIMETYDTETLTDVLQTKYGSSEFVPGYVTGTHSFYNKSTANVDLSYAYGTTAETLISYTKATAYTDAADETAKAAAFADIEETAKARKYNYAYTPAEIVPVNEVVKYTYGINIATNLGGINQSRFSNVTSRFDAYVMNEEGNVETYSFTETGISVSINGSDFVTVDFIDDSKWNKALPDTGYLVGFTIYPFADIGEVGDISFGYNTAVANYTSDKTRELIYFCHGEDYYSLIDSVLTPVVEKYEYVPSWDTSNVARKTNTFTVTNYSAMFEYEYAYGDDNVTVPTEGWTALTSDTVTSTKSSKYIWVRRLAGGGFEAIAAVSNLPSEAVAVEGLQLVLDGNIGVKVVFNYNTDVVASGHVYVNPDSSSTTAGLGEAGEHQFVLDGEGMGYVLVPFLAKEAADLNYENELIYYTAEDVKVNMSNVGGTISVASLVERYKSDAAYANELNLINALETYYKAAEAYFDTTVTEVEALADLTAEELAGLAEAKARARVETEDVETNFGLTFHSTSLLLEDNTTIRHYFKIVGGDTMSEENAKSNLSAYKVEGGSALALATSTSDAKYAYTDVAGIPSNALSEAKEVTVKFADESYSDAITVTFSALDYVDLSLNDEDAKLQNLVKALYRYSAESDAYSAQ